MNSTVHHLQQVSPLEQGHRTVIGAVESVFGKNNRLPADTLDRLHDIQADQCQGYSLTERFEALHLDVLIPSLFAGLSILMLALGSWLYFISAPIADFWFTWWASVLTVVVIGGVLLWGFLPRTVVTRVADSSHSTLWTKHLSEEFRQKANELIVELYRQPNIERDIRFTIEVVDRYHRWNLLSHRWNHSRVTGVWVKTRLKHPYRGSDQVPSILIHARIAWP